MSNRSPDQSHTHKNNTAKKFCLDGLEEFFDLITLREIQKRFENSLEQDSSTLKQKESKNGLPIISLNDRNICSPIDPLGEAKKWADHIDLSDNPSLLVVFGLGLGYHLLELKKRLPVVPIVVIEPDLDVVHKACEVWARSRDLGLDVLGKDSGLFSIENLLIVSGAENLRGHLARGLDIGQVIKFCIWTPTAKIYQKELRETVEAIKRATSLATVTGKTLESRLVTWTDNILDNLVHCVGATPVDYLRGWVDRRPVIVVSAGPSLDINIELLREVGDKALIFCVNTALSALEKAGVRADLVVAVELLDVSSQFEGLKLNSNIPRALNLMCNSNLFSSAKGPIFPYSDHLHFFAPLANRLGIEAAVGGGSVAHSAFGLANVLKAKKIIMVGQDLAYKDGNIYATGTVFDKMKVKIEGNQAHLSNLDAKRKIADSLSSHQKKVIQGVAKIEPGVEEVLAWGGEGKVWTNLAFNYFRYVFESWAAILHKVEVINATEGGARIKGFQEKRLAEVIAGLEPSDPHPLPETPTISREVIQKALEKELSAVKKAHNEAKSAKELQTTQAARRLQPAVNKSGLLSAYSWKRVGEVIQDPNADLDSLCDRIIESALELQDKLLDTRKKVNNSSSLKAATKKKKKKEKKN